MTYTFACSECKKEDRITTIEFEGPGANKEVEFSCEFKHYFYGYTYSCPKGHESLTYNTTARYKQFNTLACAWCKLAWCNPVKSKIKTSPWTMIFNQIRGKYPKAIFLPTKICSNCQVESMWLQVEDTGKYTELCSLCGTVK